MTKCVWICQCLCPQRHCLAATADEAEDERDAMPLVLQLRGTLMGLIDSGEANPWCGVCGAGRETWRYELAASGIATMEEAEPILRRWSEEAREAGAAEAATRRH